jgi:hypothetical protein
MEHVIQFAVGIDDDRIVNLVEANASKQIIGELKQQVANRIFSANYYDKNADPSRDQLSEASVKIVSDFLKDNKDNIVERASEILADKMFKSKTIREKIKDSV